jgi:hypothetical protein
MRCAIGKVHPQAPWNIPAGSGFAFHHIIPRSILIGVFNRLLEAHLGSAGAEAKTCLVQFVALCNRKHRDVERTVDRLRSDAPAARRAGHNPLLPLSVSEIDDLHRSVIWPAWDLVEGPKQRADDPKDHYLDRFTVGLIAGEAQQMRAVESLYPALLTAVAGGPSASLSASIRAARIVLNRQEPIRYRPEMWDLESKPARKRR